MYIIHSGCIPFWAVAIGHCNTCFELHRGGPGTIGGNPFIVFHGRGIIIGQYSGISTTVIQWSVQWCGSGGVVMEYSVFRKDKDRRTNRAGPDRTSKI